MNKCTRCTSMRRNILEVVKLLNMARMIQTETAMGKDVPSETHLLYIAPPTHPIFQLSSPGLQL